MLDWLNSLIHSEHPDIILPHAHSPWLVALAIVIAVFASYVALDFTGQVSAVRGRLRYTWLGWGAVVLGTGIWAMHFVAMAGFSVANLPASYDVWQVALSLASAILTAGIALFVGARERVTVLHLIGGALLMGGGIISLNYIGISAIRLPAIIHYETIPFALSFVIAFVASFVALGLESRLREARTRRERLLRPLAAMVMGGAIVSAHYMAMYGTVFHPAPELSANPSGSVTVNVLGGSAIAVAAFVVLGMAIAALLVTRRLGALSYSRKFLLIAALFSLPVLVATGLLVWTQYDRTDKYGYRETYGVEYLRPLQGILSEMMVYQWLTVERADDVVDVQALSRTQVRIDEHIQQLAQRDAEHGQLLQTTPAFEQLRAEWQTVKASALSADVPQRRAQQAQFSAHVLELIAHVGNTSYLILDPEIETFYLMDSAVLVQPQFQITLGRLLALNKELTAERALTVDEQTEIILVGQELEQHISRMQTDLTTAYPSEEASEGYPKLESALTNLSVAVGEAAVMLQQRIGDSDAIVIAPEAFENGVNRLREAADVYYATNSEELEDDIAQRISRETLQMWGTVAAALVAEALAVLAGLFLIRTITQPMLELTAATGRLAGGELNARVNVSGTDEVGQLGASFNNMAERLQASQTEVAERAKALATNLEVSRRLSTVLNPQQLVSEVVQQLQSAFGYYHAHIYLWDEARQNLVMMGGTGEAGRLLLARGHKLPKGRGLVGRAAENAQTVLVPDTAADPQWLPNPLLPETRAEVAVPILLGTQVLGVIDVQQNRINGLTPLDAELVQSLANQVAIALQNAQSFERTKRQADRQTLLNTISLKIQSASSVEAVLETAARELGQALGAQQTSVQLAHDAAHTNGKNGAPPAPGEPSLPAGKE